MLERLIQADKEFSNHKSEIHYQIRDLNSNKNDSQNQQKTK
jgi:hypothetical protein